VVGIQLKDVIRLVEGMPKYRCQPATVKISYAMHTCRNVLPIQYHALSTWYLYNTPPIPRSHMTRCVNYILHSDIEPPTYSLHTEPWASRGFWPGPYIHPILGTPQLPVSSISPAILEALETTRRGHAGSVTQFFLSHWQAFQSHGKPFNPVSYLIHFDSSILSMGIPGS